MRFLPVSLQAFLVELKTLEETLDLFNTLQANPLPGIEEVIPAANSLLISFSPYEASADELAGRIIQLKQGSASEQKGKSIEIPVDYNGEDLPALSALTGLTVAEIIHRHTAPDYKVAFCGFAPGFGYLTGGDASLRVPRHKTPRTRIPAGSVGLAGGFTGVYPQASPGGWQIIGTTPVKMWDLARTQAALFQPGDHVRFFDLADKKRSFFIPEGTVRAQPITASHDAGFLILSAPLPALFQDLGRFGQTGQGVCSSGALDHGSFKAANRLVGNIESEACLELAGGGFRFRSQERFVAAFTGAPCDITVHTAAGETLSPAFYKPVALEPDDEVTLSAPKAGTRSYMAVRGGFVVDKPLGSAATDTLSGIGPEPIRTGRQLLVKPAKKLSPVSLFESPTISFLKPGEVVEIDIVLGPRADWFTPESFVTLSETAWEVTERSNRVGIRLTSEAALTRMNTAELPSEGCVAGALEVPPDGKPLLLLADHPLTGGYPVIGAVAGYHLDLAGQIPIGAKIRFRPLAAFSTITPKPVAH